MILCNSVLKRLALWGILATVIAATAESQTTPQTRGKNPALAAKLVYPNVYTVEEKRALDEFAARLAGGQGSGPSGGTVAGGGAQTSTDSAMSLDANAFTMKLYANAFDYWNPLFNDSSYAARTKYGAIIALPFYREPGVMFPSMNIPALGSWRGSNDGGDVEFFVPIRAGDTFTTKTESQTFKDITPSAGSTARVFNLAGSGSLYNQKGELVMRGTMYGRNFFERASAQAGTAVPGTPPTGQPPSGNPPQGQNMAGTPPPGGGPGGAGGPGMPGGNPPPDGSGGAKGAGASSTTQGTKIPTTSASEATGKQPARHVYTEAELRLIDSVIAGEKVRGDETLYWEDVKVGERPSWVTTGQTTVLDMVRCFGLQIIQSPPTREQLKNPENLQGMRTDRYNVRHLMEEAHFGDMGEGGVPIFYMAYGRNLMARLVTNYIGDGGWLAKFSWRNQDMADAIISEVRSLSGKKVTGHGKVGDCLFAKAEVVKKYIEAGQHKVDLVCWTEDIEGTLCQAARATVILPARN